MNRNREIKLHSRNPSGRIVIPNLCTWRVLAWIRALYDGPNAFSIKNRRLGEPAMYVITDHPLVGLYSELHPGSLHV